MAMKPRSLKVEDDEWKAWQKKAEQAGIGLSEWIRARCNGGDTIYVSGEVGTRLVGVAALAEAKEQGNNRADKASDRGGRRVSSKRGIRVEPKIRNVGATCKHGTPKGYNCWLCGGIADVK
jgi:hypothetical protein